MPRPSFDPVSYSAAQRQINFWQRNLNVKVITRSISYPKNWNRYSINVESPREKGIDVALAVDFVALAFKKEYELGLIFSADTDLRPALEYVNSDEVKPRAEVVAWRGGKPHFELSAKKSAYCHWINAQEFIQVSDTISYTR